MSGAGFSTRGLITPAPPGSQGTIIEECDDSTEWATHAGTGTIANAAGKEGIGLQITDTAGGNFRVKKVPATPVPIIGQGYLNRFGCWIWSSAASKAILIWMSNAAGSIWQYYIHSAGEIRAGWNYVTWTADEWTAGSGWGTYDIGRIDFQTPANTTIVVEDLRIGCYAKPSVCITFDDGHESIYDAAYTTHMQPKGLPGTFYCISSLVGTGSYMTESEISTLYGNGWTIGNHLDDGTAMSSRTIAQAQAGYATCRDYVAARWPGGENHCGYIGGSYTATNGDARSAFISEGMLTGRLGTMLTDTYNPTVRGLAQPDLLLNFAVLGVSKSLASVKTGIEDCIKHGGNYICSAHTIVPSGAANEQQWNAADFEALCVYLKEKQDQGVLDVVSIKTMYDKYHVHSVRRGIALV